MVNIGCMEAIKVRTIARGITLADGSREPADRSRLNVCLGHSLEAAKAAEYLAKQAELAREIAYRAESGINLE